jgi:uncharacterized membrane protein
VPVPYYPNADIPPGWDANPSDWAERLPVLLLAGAGFLIASYLTLYQLGVFSHIFEPFFGNDSRRILHSWLSRVLPVPDASLGAAGYLADIILGVTGGRDRWRRLPGVVVLYGLAVCGVCTTSVLFVILQPLLFHGYCTLCMTSALVSTLMVGPALVEVLAALQHLKQALATGQPFWQALFGEGRSSMARGH